jgi:hypothetical protein
LKPPMSSEPAWTAPNYTPKPSTPEKPQPNVKATETKTERISKSNASIFQPDKGLVRPSDNEAEYWADELLTPKLNRIHSSLWLAGLPRRARPLYRHHLVGRTIYPTENPDEHLVWYENRIFMKPIPELLFNIGFWEDFLCRHRALYESACGLLLSYCWLIRHKSDFRLAKTYHLLPDDMSWKCWDDFVVDFLNNVTIVNKRYEYGELRLSRLNSLWRFKIESFNLHDLVFGYMSKSSWYQQFFARKFKWLLIAFAYITVILSAMQVGQNTDRLGSSTTFQRLCYGFSLASVLGTVSSMATVFAVWAALFWYHLISTKLFCQSLEAGKTRVDGSIQREIQ